MPFLCLPLTRFNVNQSRWQISRRCFTISRLAGRTLDFSLFENGIADGFAFAMARTFGGKHPLIIDQIRCVSHATESANGVYG